MNAPKEAGSGYRLLTFEEKRSGRYSNGRSEYWSNGQWHAAASHPDVSLSYRVPTCAHNPEGFPDYILDTAKYRHLKKDELDGRFNGKAEFYMSSLKEWIMASNATSLDITFRIEREPSMYPDNPSNIPEDTIDLKRHRLVTREEKKTAKWANKAEYWDSDKMQWVITYCADMNSVTYRLDRKYDREAKNAVFPDMPEEFKHRPFTEHEIAQVCALYDEVDVPDLLAYWGCKQVPGVQAFVYDPPEQVKVLTLREQLPEFFTHEELAIVLDSNYDATRMEQRREVIPVPGAEGTWMFASVEENPKSANSFDLFKSAMNPMFSYSDTKSFITHAEFWNYLETGKIQKIAGTEKYEFTNN